MNIKLIFATTLFFVLLASKAQLSPTKKSNVFSFDIGDRNVLGSSIFKVNDSTVVYQNPFSDGNNVFSVVNVNDGKTFDKVFLKDDYINHIKLVRQVFDNDKIIFVSNRNVAKAKRKFIAFYIYNTTTKDILPVEFSKSTLPKTKNDVYIDYDDFFIDKFKKNIYFNSISNQLAIKYSFESKEFSIITDFQLERETYKLLNAENDYLNTKKNNLGYVQSVIEKSQNNSHFQEINPTSENYIKGIVVVKNVKSNEIDTLKFANQIEETLNFSEKLIVFLKNKKADINYVKEIPRAYKEAWARQDSLKRVLAQKELDEIYKKNNKVEEQVTITKTPSTSIIYDFYKTCNVYRSFKGGEVRGDFQELKWQVRFIAKENSINQYWEKDGFPATSFKLYETFNVIENKKTENFKYVYVINNITAIFYNTSTPTTITITKDGGKTFTEYATYDSYNKKFK